jgi:prepilin signal peptidase PulO-like enzyme (type II secretory pathway)
MDESMIPLAVHYVFLFLAGICLGSLVNWAIYSLAWNARPVSPWSRLPADQPARRRSHRLPVVGWLRMRHEAALHGRGFWIRPMLLEIGLGAALVALYWWEVVRLGLIEGQAGVAVAAPAGPVHWQFASHVILFCWMLAASFIDIDEKIIPDEITVTGTLLGLALATLVPISLLPHVTAQPPPPQNELPAIQLKALPPARNAKPINAGLWLEPVTAVSPRPWPPEWGRTRGLKGLCIGLGCYWLWCFALAPRIWRGRRGAAVAIGLIISRLRREFTRPPLLWLWLVGTAAVFGVWAIGGGAWSGLLTALLGLVGSGLVVWAVRLVGTLALRREAMGFGDVTLMMMVGTFLGWQACLISFFIAPVAGLVVGLTQFISRRDDVIPYGPFLCIASAWVVVAWASIWRSAQLFFDPPQLVLGVFAVGLVLLGLMLGIWRMIKMVIFGVGE